MTDKEPSKKKNYRKGPLGICHIDDCGKKVFARMLCYGHYMIMLEAERRAGLVIGKNGKPKGGPGFGLRKGNGSGASPKIVNDEATIKRLRDLAGLQCTIPEMAGVMQCSDETLRTFLLKNPNAADAVRDGKEQGKASLRRMQFVQAKRSAAMGIWLGKNYLNQRDTMAIGPIGDGPGPIELGSEEGATALLRAVQSESE